MKDPRKNFCPFDCTETRHHDHGSDGNIYLEPANNVPAEKWEREFDEKFEEKYRHSTNPDATEHCKNCSIRHEYQYHSLSQDKQREWIKSFIRQAISEAVKEERERIIQISSRLIDTVRKG